MVRYPVYSPPQYELPDIIDICLSDPNILNGNNSSNGINSGEIGINGSNTDYDPSSDLNPTNLVSMPKKLTVSTLTTLLGHEHLNGIVNNSKSKIPHYPSSSQPPDIHIATPAPSPTLTPQHTGNSRSHSSNSAELDLGLNTKGRRLFNTNPHFPNIYPIDGAGSGNGGVDGDNIPFNNSKFHGTRIN
ncbi:unnamed protein product [[Candida] boidinii]|nr:unnamed protein product [[Candida] boidinii]